MISNKFRFQEFLDAVKDGDLPEIIVMASNEAAEAERCSLSYTKGSVKNKRMGSGDYYKKVNEFAFFMGHGIKPSGVYEEDFKLYRPICENLVKKGQLKHDVLNHFDKTD